MPDSPSCSNGKWEVVPCLRGSTLLERESGQLMHSRIGAWEEANSVYVAQSGPLFEPGRRESPDSSESNAPVVIYDVGMGIAANALAAIARHAPLRIFSFERYPEALEAALAQGLENPGLFPFHAPYREALGALLKEGRVGEKGVEWTLLAGDFREARLAELPPADLVYFDFYAPSVCPELWGVETFSRLRRKMAERGRLITYSTAKSVRVSLLLAGFFVGVGAPTAMKSATTLAFPGLAGSGGPERPGRLGDGLLGRDWLASLDRSTKPLPDGWRRLAEHPQFRAG